MDCAEISVKGVTSRVPSAQINGRTVVVTGKWLKVAAVKDEAWQEGDIAAMSEEFVTELKNHRELTADIFTFGQKPNDPTPRFPFLFQWESIAAIPIGSYADWWANRVSSDLRKDVRRASKRGVVVRRVLFTDEFVTGIMSIYNETPVRQGRRFWHYGKGFDAVKMENATYLERSDFIGAFLGDDLIGFLKIVYVGPLACLMQILAKEAHRDSRPMNALIAKAVDVCDEKGCSHLTYGKYRYSQGGDGLTAFKRRNGFEEILVPRYYLPLTAKGWLALRLNLHHGPKALLPNVVQRSLTHLRASFYRQRRGSERSDEGDIAA